jgi:hypothetical protein
MKLIVTIILTFGLFACNNSTDKRSVESNNTKGSSIQITEFYDCNFNKFINDPMTPKLAKDIYLGNEWNFNNDNEVLSLLDSLTAKDNTSRPFYFKVITKSVEKSDGYYSEGLGLAGYEFVENHTQEFSSFFDNKKCHTNRDLETWADIVIIELSIIDEGNFDKPIVDDYIHKLRLNCNNCPTPQKETINKFGLILKEKWNEFMEHIE